MLRFIKLALVCFCLLNMAASCSSEDPEVPTEKPGDNSGSGDNGNGNEEGDNNPTEQRYAFRVHTVQDETPPAVQAEQCIESPHSKTTCLKEHCAML